MTKVYFVRHAQPNFHHHEDLTRELSEDGLKDREKVTTYFSKRKVDVVISSPCKRAIDTVKPLADTLGLQIEVVDDFRERKITDGWIADFNTFCRRQWEDYSYKLANGESLCMVQKRNIAALERVLEIHDGKNIVIGSHGTALSTIIHYYDASFGYESFERIRNVMPWVVELVFEQKTCIGIREIEL